MVLLTSAKDERGLSVVVKQILLWGVRRSQWTGRSCAWDMA